MKTFDEIYKSFIDRGYRSGFIREKIAEHCSVSEHTVAGWIAGKSVRAVYLNLLNQFKIGEIK